MNKKIYLLIFLSLFILTCLSATTFNNANKFEFYYKTGSSGGAFKNDWLAQSFRIGTNGTNTSFDISGVMLHVAITSTEMASVCLWDVDSTTLKPTTLIANSCNDTIDPSSWVGNWENVTLPSTTLTKGKIYAIVFNTTANLASIEWTDDNNVDGYKGGQAWRSDDDATTWTAQHTDSDYSFEIWGIETCGIDLYKPEQSSTVNFGSPTNFNCTASSGGGNIQNITLWIDGVNNKTLSHGTSTFFNFIDSVENLALGNHNWTCEARNTTNGVKFAISNRTFDVGAFTLNSENYDAEVAEGTSHEFKINITIGTGQSISSTTFHYNNTETNGIVVSTGTNNYSISAEKTAANVVTNSNATFFWEVVLASGITSNTSSINQSVLAVTLDDCSSNSVLILNYTIKDEDSQDVLVGGDHNTIIEVDIDLYAPGTSTPAVEYSQNYTKHLPAQVCITTGSLNSSTFQMYVTTKYKADDYEPEYYFIQNYTLTNQTIPQNVILYDLLTSRSTDFLVTYKDDTFLPVSSALIQITRKYISEGIFKTVEIARTDEDGRAVGHFVLDEPIYTIIVTKNGETLSTFDNVAVVCDDSTIGDCKINLDAFSSGTVFDDFDTSKNLDFTMFFDPPSRTVTATFVTVDGSTSLVSLNTTRYDMFGNETVCSDSITSSAGTLTCIVPQTYGNITIVSRLWSGGELITSEIYRIEQDPEDIWGGVRFVMMLILIITIPLMFISSPIGIVLGVGIGFIVAVSLSIISGSSIIGTASSIIWLLVASLIIIWRIAKRS